MVLKNLQRQQSRGPGIYISVFKGSRSKLRFRGASEGELSHSWLSEGLSHGAHLDRGGLQLAPLFLGSFSIFSFGRNFSVSFGLARNCPKLSRVWSRTQPRKSANSQEWYIAPKIPPERTRTNPNEPEPARTSPKRTRRSLRSPREPEVSRNEPTPEQQRLVAAKIQR